MVHEAIINDPRLIIVALSIGHSKFLVESPQKISAKVRKQPNKRFSKLLATDISGHRLDVVSHSVGMSRTDSHTILHAHGGCWYLQIPASSFLWQRWMSRGLRPISQTVTLYRVFLGSCHRFFYLGPALQDSAKPLKLSGLLASDSRLLCVLPPARHLVP